MAANCSMSEPPVLLEVQHETRYGYAAPVTQAQHLAYLQPLHDERQQLLDHELLIEPAPLQRLHDTDAYGHARVLFSREQPHRALETHFIARIGRPFEERDDVFDVRLLEKPQPAGDRERDPAHGQLHLDFQTLEMRPIEHGHLFERDSLVTQFQHPLRDKRRLAARIIQRDERRLRTRSLPRRAQILFIATRVHPDRRVG